jgi:hypothetical protein
VNKQYNYPDYHQEDSQRQIFQEATEDVSKADQDQKWKHDKYD